jgi:hypothetical protein
MGPLSFAAEVTLFLTKKVRPVNSLLFIADPEGGQAPKPVRGVRLRSTSSCVSVGCYPEQDGPTEVLLGDSTDVNPGFEPIFDGNLKTPNRAVVVSTAVYEKLLEAPVPDTHTRIRVWVNHPRWPDKIIIGMN